jgi:hypothetical protein
LEHIRLIIDYQNCMKILFRIFGHRLKSSLARLSKPGLNVLDRTFYYIRIPRERF